MELLSLLDLVMGIVERVKPQKILLAVEDSAEDAMLLREELLSVHAKFDIARTAEEALGLLQVKQYSVALIDIGLPAMDGVELSHIIHDKYCRTRVYFVTGSSFVTMKESELICVIRKPITAEILRAILK